MNPKEKACKKVTDLDLQHIVTLIACYQVKDYNEKKDTYPSLCLYDTVIPYKKTFIAIKSHKLLGGCMVYILDSEPVLVFDFYEGETFVFRDGPWVDFIIDFYNERIKKQKADYCDFEENRWKSIDL